MNFFRIKKQQRPTEYEKYIPEIRSMISYFNRMNLNLTSDEVKKQYLKIYIEHIISSLSPCEFIFIISTK